MSDKLINYLLAIKAILFIILILYLLNKVIFNFIIVLLVYRIRDTLKILGY